MQVVWPVTHMYAYNIHDMYWYTDQLNPQFSNLTIQLDVHIGYYTRALITQDHLQSQNSSIDRMLSMYAVTRFQV